jgi:hypothetical protein
LLVRYALDLEDRRLIYLLELDLAYGVCDGDRFSNLCGPREKDLVKRYLVPLALLDRELSGLAIVKTDLNICIQVRRFDYLKVGTRKREAIFGSRVRKIERYGAVDLRPVDLDVFYKLFKVHKDP